MEETGAKAVAEQPVVAQPETATVPVQAEKTYTQKELDTILAEAREREEARVKGLNKVVSKKDTEIEALRKSASPDAATLPLLRKMAQALEETIPSGYADDEGSKKAKAKLADIKAEIATMQANTEKAKQEAIRDGMWNRIKELGLNPDPSAEDYDERLDPIVAFWTAGNTQLAQQRLDKLSSRIEKEKAVKVVEQPKPISPTPDLEKVKAELRAEIIKEYGLDKQNTGGPSAVSASRGELYKKYADGLISTADYMKAISQ